MKQKLQKQKPDNGSTLTLQTYIDIIHPKKFQETIEKIAKKPDDKITFVNVLLLSLLSILLVLISQFSNPEPATASGFLLLDKLADFNEVSSVPAIILTFIGGIVFFYLSAAILNFIANALGGNGKFSSLIYLSSILWLTSTIVLFPLDVIIYFMPLIACLLFIPILIFSIYAIYINYKILRGVYRSLSRGRAIAAYILSIIFDLVLSFIYLFVRVMIGI